MNKILVIDINLWFLLVVMIHCVIYKEKKYLLCKSGFWELSQFKVLSWYDCTAFNCAARYYILLSVPDRDYLMIKLSSRQSVALHSTRPAQIIFFAHGLE